MIIPNEPFCGSTGNFYGFSMRLAKRRGPTEMPSPNLWMDDLVREGLLARYQRG